MGSNDHDFRSSMTNGSGHFRSASTPAMINVLDIISPLHAFIETWPTAASTLYWSTHLMVVYHLCEARGGRQLRLMAMLGVRVRSMISSWEDPLLKLSST